MKNLVTANDWAKIEDALMQAQIPFYVSFDAHVDENLTSVTYDKYIRIEPFVIQTTKEVKTCQ